MQKKWTAMILAGLVALPAMARMARADSLEDRVSALEDKADSWDLASRIQWSGDFRFRVDYLGAKAPAQYSAFSVASNMANIAYNAFNIPSASVLVANLQNMLQMPGFNTAAGRQAALGAADFPDTDYDNNTLYTNRFRLNMRVKAMENLEFKGRLVMYKVWGMESNVNTFGGPYTLNSLSFDGNASRQPQDSILRVDRAFMNWNNIADLPIWFSVGRRPVTDGPPAQLRMGTGEKMATPVEFMDYPFDGASLGYAYRNLFGIPDAPGRVRLCYGRGFEAGLDVNEVGLNDVDFGGLSWDVYHKGDTFFNFQSFVALNIFNIPGDVTFPNPLEIAYSQVTNTPLNPYQPSNDGMLERTNLGDIYHTSSVFMSKVGNLNYFLTGGWSHTDPRGGTSGMDEMGNSLLGSWGEDPSSHDGYCAYVGVRYDMDNLGLKVGAEYNYGSKYWISFTPGNDDIYASKLAARGNVYELYTIWDIPAGEAISKYAKGFFRLGYQHYDYDYSGSGYWLGAPVKVDDLANDPLNAQLYPTVKRQDQVYLTMEAWF